MTSLLNSVFDWRPRTPFFYGWLILAMAFLATFAATGATQVVLGGVQVFITDDTGWERSTVSFSATAGTWASGLLAPFIGRLADRYGPRWLMPVGMLIVAAAFFSIAGANGAWQFFAAYFLGRAVGNAAIIDMVPRTAAVNFFRRRRNMALALVSTFRPIGSAVTLQIISLIAIRWGWRAAYRYCGIIGLILVVPILLVMRRRPEDIGLQPDGARPLRPTPGETQAVTSRGARQRLGAREAEFSWTTKEALSTKSFWLLVVTVASSTLATATVGFSLVPFLVEDVGISRGQATGVLSLGTFLAVGNLGWAYLADVMTPRLCLSVAMIAAGAIVLFLTTVSSFVTALGFAVVFGITSGPAGMFEAMILAQYYGRSSYGTILGVFVPFQTVTLGLGPALGSVFREDVGSYTGLYVAMAGVYFAAALFVFMARPPLLPDRAYAESVSGPAQLDLPGG